MLFLMKNLVGNPFLKEFTKNIDPFYSFFAVFGKNLSRNVAFFG